MPSTTRPRSRSGASARSKAKTNGGRAAKVRTLEIRGVTLDLPTTVPFKLLKHMRNGRDSGAQDVVALLETVLGDQMDAVWEIPVNVSKGLEPLGDLLDELTTRVLAEYGVGAGE